MRQISFKFNNHIEIPQIGVGTWTLRDPETFPW
jgi:diketogulonate reductase-like aldo/keto reductase